MTVPTPEATERQRMSDWFGSVSYVNEYLDGLPEVTDDDDDDSSAPVVASAGDDDVVTPDLLGPEGQELLDFTWDELIAGPNGWEAEEVGKPDRGMQPAAVLTNAASGRRFLVKECNPDLVNAPTAEQDVSALLRTAGIPGASHVMVSHVDPNVVVSSFAGEPEGVLNLVKVREAVKHPNPTLAEYQKLGVTDMQQLVDILVCDALVENQDRSGFNLFIGKRPDGSTLLLPFDHGGAFGIQKQAPRRSVAEYLSAPGGVLRPALREYAQTQDWKKFVLMVETSLHKFRDATEICELAAPNRRAYLTTRVSSALADIEKTAEALIDDHDPIGQTD